MQKLLLSLFIMLANILFIYSYANASIYECSLDKTVFTDLNQCNSVCSIGCAELDVNDKNSGSCEENKYQGFFYYKDKTYALTKSAVKFNAERNAKIIDEKHNTLVKNMLSTFGVNEAWLGLYDKNMSSQYNVIDIDRYIWVDGSNKKYVNFRKSEPDNKLDDKSIGHSSIYGEHWVTISVDGFWQDVGYNTDGSEKLLPAVIEFNGNLACVSGTPKKDESVGKQLCKDGSTDCMMCASDNSPITGVAEFSKCSYSAIAPITDKGMQIGETKYDYLCGIDRLRCYADQTPYDDIKEDVFYDRLPDITSSDKKFEEKDGTTIFNDGAGNVRIHFTHMVWDWGKASWFTKTYNSSISFANRFPVEDYISSEVEILSYLSSNEPPVNYSGCYGNDIKLSDEASCKIENRNINSDVNIAYRVKYRVKKYDYKYNCPAPHSNRSCMLEKDNFYYCSPRDCADTGNENNFIDTDTSIGDNDKNNNGEIADNGSCLGELSIFSGKESRCRPVGSQHEFTSCCRAISIEKAQSGDYDISGCKQEELKVMVDKHEDRCVSIGDFCSEAWFGGSVCVQRKETLCCYDDDFQRAFAEAGKEMLGKSWGVPESARCEGFTPDEVQVLGAMGIGDHPKLREYGEKFGKKYADKLIDDFNSNFQNEVPTISNGIINQIESK